jgi:hypothetical protein
VGNVGARELQYALASKGVLEGFFAHGAFAADKGSLAPRAASVDVAGHDVVVDAPDPPGAAADD